MGYYHLKENEHLAFPKKLCVAVARKRLKSRSKHKNYGEDQYIWILYYCEYEGAGRMVFPSLCQYYKFRPQSEWGENIEGLHEKILSHGKSTTKIDFWKSIRECVESFGLEFDKTRLSPWSDQLLQR